MQGAAAGVSGPKIARGGKKRKRAPRARGEDRSAARSRAAEDAADPARGGSERAAGVTGGLVFPAPPWACPWPQYPGAQPPFLPTGHCASLALFTVFSFYPRPIFGWVVIFVRDTGTKRQCGQSAALPAAESKTQEGTSWRTEDHPRAAEKGR